MKKIYLALLLLISFSNGYAQTVSNTSNKLKPGGELLLKLGVGNVKGGFYQPLSFAIGPLAGPRTFGTISSPTLKLGLMGGIDYNYYFNSYIGASGTFDFFSNKYNVIEATNPPFVTANIQIASQKNQINKFVGLGPIGRLPIGNKFHATVALYGGLLFHKKNSYQADYTAAVPAASTMVKFNSTKSVSAFAAKGSVRFAYDHSPRLGFSLGAEYIIPFFSTSQKQAALMHPSSTGYLINFPNQVLAGGTATVFNSGYNSSGLSALSTLQREPVAADLKLLAINLAVHLKFGVPRIPKAPKTAKTKKKKCCGTCPVYALGVTARDKFTKEILPNTDVVIKNNKGEIVKTGRTNSFGVFVFEKIIAEDYTISGLLNNIALENGSIKKDELICDEVIQKEILYTDRNFIVKGKVLECKTNNPMSGINVILENSDLAYEKATMTDAQGNFMLKLPEIGIYYLHAKKDNFLSQLEEVTSDNYNRDKTLFVQLEICVEKVDCGKAINLKNILFDLDKYAIKAEAKKELNRLVQFMKDNPSVKVEVGSHTDCRNTDAYNQTLSENRAKASVDYVVSQGIARDRISGKGYGETVLLNRCADGVDCSEAEHSINRRTEMKVICPNK
jgi:outer membrane protein OmpA-like peptidoglycan-associated protein